MTISYSGSLFKLLFRWKGSLWKAVWMELLVFLIAYYCIFGVYKGIQGYSKDYKETFEKVSIAFDSYTERIPITFLLGFYVTSVVRRWWEQFQLIGWPDDALTYINMIFPGPETPQRQKRRTVARWLNLTAALSWRDVSVSVRKRFPTLDHLVSAGLMTDTELKYYHSVSSPMIKWFLPLQWIQRLVEKDLYNAETKTGSPPVIAHFLRELNLYRHTFRQLYCYDWVCLPLVYTQVACLATYGYFVLCLIGRQFIEPDTKMEGMKGREVVMYFPIFTVLQFLFYVGWFKVGQYLMRPFEEDDDDLELNYLLDRHMQAAFALVDEVVLLEPTVGEDKFMYQKVPTLPYTRLSSKERQHPPKLHTHVKVRKPKDAEAVIETSLKPPKEFQYF